MIKNYLELQIQPQSAKEIINTLVDIGGSMKGGISKISHISLAIGVAGTGAILIPALIITHNENKTLKEQYKELNKKTNRIPSKEKFNEQKI